MDDCIYKTNQSEKREKHFFLKSHKSPPALAPYILDMLRLVHQDVPHVVITPAFQVENIRGRFRSRRVVVELGPRVVGCRVFDPGFVCDELKKVSVFRDVY